MSFTIIEDGVSLVVEPTGRSALVEAPTEKELRKYDAKVLGEVLKSTYADTIKQQLNNSTAFMKLLQKEVPITGKAFNIPIHRARNTSVVPWKSDTLPTAGMATYENVTFTREELEDIQEKLRQGREREFLQEQYRKLLMKSVAEEREDE